MVFDGSGRGIGPLADSLPSGGSQDLLEVAPKAYQARFTEAVKTVCQGGESWGRRRQAHPLIKIRPSNISAGGGVPGRSKPLMHL